MSRSPSANATADGSVAPTSAAIDGTKFKASTKLKGEFTRVCARSEGAIVILLVLVAVLWLVVLAPSAWRRFSERRGVGSVDHFHHQLELLENAGPKLVTPAYRLHGMRSKVDGGVVPPPPAAASSGPTLVLLRAVNDGESADIHDVDGAHYERVGVIERPEPTVNPAQTKAGLAAHRRQQARRRCTLVLRILTVTAIGTGLLGMLPTLRLAWFFTAFTGIAALALVGLISHARELESQRRRLRSLARARYADEPDPAPGAAQAGLPGAWDEDDEMEYEMEYEPQRRAAGGR